MVLKNGHPFCRRPTRDDARTPRPLEVIAAQPTVHIADFSGEKQAVLQAAHHGRGRDFGQRDAARRCFGLFVGADGVNVQRASEHLRAQSGDLLFVQAAQRQVLNPGARGDGFGQTIGQVRRQSVGNVLFGVFLRPLAPKLAFVFGFDCGEKRGENRANWETAGANAPHGG